MSKKLSIIIPAYKEPYLQATIDSILENIEGDTEILVIIDGDWLTTPLK
jgi:glycosyltransferase involved in cell wall biosynthesis